MKMTIIEALAELKAIDRVIQQKRARVLNQLAQKTDPKSFLDRERHTIAQLELRSARIHRAISAANDSAFLTIGGETMTVTEWLCWRRRWSSCQTKFLANIVDILDQQTGERELADVMTDELAKVEADLVTLQGQLTLINTTTTIEV